MKLIENDIKIDKSEDIVESMFGLSSKDSAHILNILRSKLYSNKILAVVREYCANAQDAHAEVGKTDIPIKVCLPNNFDSTFKVRDYGTGLSENDIRTIYVMYGASTKRTTNKAIGQLGLGCKSAFAYTDKFHIISWFNGEKKTYCAYIDETKCGKIALLATTKSIEPDGIEVQVPVHNNDFTQFSIETQKILKYFTPIPIIIGNNIIVTKPKYWMEGIIDNNIKFCIHDHGSNNRYGSSTVIMGGIPYVINKSRVNTGEWNSIIDNYISMGVDIYVNIGDLEVTANREELEYTNYTITNLEKYIKETAREALKLGSLELTKASTYREANLSYYQMTLNHSFWHNIKNTSQWKGKPLDGMILPNSKDYTILYPIQYSHRIQWEEEHGLSIKTGNSYSIDTVSKDFIIYEINDSYAWQKRLSIYLKYNNINAKQARAIKWNGENDTEKSKIRAEVFTKRNLDEYTFKNISDCTVPPEALTEMKKNKVITTRSTTHIGTIFNLNSQNERHDGRAKSKNWTRTDKYSENIKKYYVELNKFYPILNGKSCSLNILDSLLKTIELTNKEIKTKDVYGIKKKQINKITHNSDWVSLYTIAKETIGKSDIPTKLADYYEYENNAPIPTKLYATAYNAFPTKSIAYELLASVNRLKNTYNVIKPVLSEVTYTLRLLDISIPKPSISLNTMINQTAKKYPLTSTSQIFPESERYREPIIKNAFPHVVEYVNLIENCKNKKEKTV